MSNTLSAKSALNLETSHLQGISQLYPEAMREPFLWLGDFLARKCDRSLALLEDKIRRLKLETNSQTLAKMIRGQWKTDARGRALSAPCLSEQNFLQLVERLREQDRLEHLSGAVDFIMTPTAEKIIRHINIRRSPKRICKFTLIIGPTGSQKTATFQHFQRLNPGTVFWLEAPAKNSFNQFISELGALFQIPRGGGVINKMARLRQTITESTTLIMDNIQRLYRNEDESDQPIFSYLQELQETTRCTVVLCSTPTFGETMQKKLANGFLEQFEGRCGGRKQFLFLDSFAPREDILAIAHAFHLKDAGKHIQYLEDIARQPGRIRILFNTFQTAAQDAEEIGEPLTINHLRAAFGDEEWDAQ